MRVATILGPSQAGKTTLAGALAALDDERPRRLTLYGDVAATRFSFMGEPWAILDAPGGSHNLPLVSAALAASDAAILCVPAEADAAVLAAPYLRLIEAAGLPTFLFINKIDAAADRLADIAAALQAFSGHAIILRQIPMMEGRSVVGAVDLISERAWAYHEGQRSSLVEIPPGLRETEEKARAELLDHLADFDDALLEELIEDKKPLAREVYDVATRVMQHHDLIPALIGAAAHGNGLLRLMKSLRHETPAVAETARRLNGAVAAGCFADSVKHLGKVVLIRALTDGIGAGQKVGGASIGSLVDLDTRTPLAALAAGEIGLTVKSDHLGLTAPLFGRDGSIAPPPWVAPRPPAFRSLIAPVHERDDARLATALARLIEIDPGLAIDHEARTGRTILLSQGPLHQRRVIDKLDEVFGVQVEIAPLAPALCETLVRPVEMHHRHRKQSGGAGQFADVLIEVVPRERGEGFAFAEEIKGGAVPRNYIPSVEAGAQDALAAGPHGHPVVDIGVTLKDGKFHAVDSSDYAFRTAGKQAVKEALAEGGTRVLQPIRHFTVSVPSALAGALVPLVTGLHGQVLGFRADPEAQGWDLFEALLPEAADQDFFQALGSATRGTAWYRSDLERYEEVH